MWFVGPWPPLFIAASHTQKSTTLQTHTHSIQHIHSLTHTVCLSYVTLPPHSFLVRNQKWSVMVLIHKWRPMRPLRSPVAFLAIKEPPEGSCWVKLKAHQVLLIKTGEWGASVPPQKQNGEEEKKPASKQSIRQKCMTAKFEHCFCDGNDRPFAPLPLPHI